MSALVALYLALWATVSPGTVVHELDGPVHFVDLYGNDRQTQGALGCDSIAGAELWLGPNIDLETLVHELAHANDCLDDGILNGSPMPRPSARPAWISNYCWNSDIEWYACWVTHSGRLSSAPLPPISPIIPADAPHPWLVASEVARLQSPPVPASTPAAPAAAAPVAPPMTQPEERQAAAKPAARDPQLEPKPRTPTTLEADPPTESRPEPAVQQCRSTFVPIPDDSFMELGFGPYPLGLTLAEVCSS